MMGLPCASVRPLAAPKSTRRTRALASAVPLRLKLDVVRVTPSVLLRPLSPDAKKVGAVSVVGGVVSMVKLSAPLSALQLPA